jgi:hypothetical protein
MATIEEVLAVLNQVLGAMATRPDCGAWGEPADYSLILRQDQPGGAGQYKVEDLPVGQNDIIARPTAGDIAAVAAGDLTEEEAPAAGDMLLGWESGGAMRKFDVGDLPPKAHKDSHDPEDGSDALDTAAASEIAGVQAAGTGSSHGLARADHAHQIQHGIADNHLVTVDGTPAAGEFAKWTANGLVGHKLRRCFVFKLENPELNDEYPVLACGTDLGYEIVEVRYRCYGAGGDLAFNLDIKSATDPEAAYPVQKVFTDADENATTAGGHQSKTDMNNTTVDEYETVTCRVTAVTTAPTSLWVWVITEDKTA